MKKFCGKVTLLLLLCAVAIGSLNFIYIHFKLFDSELRNFHNVPKKLRVCNFGSSHGKLDFNYVNAPDDFTVFNFALSAQSLDYDYRIMQQYKEHIDKDSVVFLPVSYFSLVAEPEENKGNFKSKNKRYYYFLRKEYIKELDRETYYILQYIPLLSSPKDFFYFVKSLVSRKKVSFSQKDTKVTDIDLDKYVRHTHKEQFGESGELIVNNSEVEALTNMIKLCKSKGAKVILLTTPYLPEYTNLIRKNRPGYIENFHDIIRNIAKENDVEYYDYAEDERFINNYDLFSDGDHLNRTGAQVFTTMLMKRFCQ